jgi:hypothetical protein
VSVELPEVLIDVGTKLGVISEGRSDAPNVTVPVKPFRGPTVIVKLALLPAVTVCEFGDADRVKSGFGGAAATVTLTAVLWARLPLVPVIPMV